MQPSKSVSSASTSAPLAIGCRFVPPSSIETTDASLMSGHTHSFLPQTDEPYGQVVRL